MATTFSKNTNALNLDGSVSSLVIPFVIASAAGVAVVHVGVRSEDVTVLSVVDNLGNNYTQKAAVTASYTVTPGSPVAGYPPVGYPGQQPVPLTRSCIDAESWGFYYTTGAVTTITVTLTNPARFGVQIDYYTGCTQFGHAATASLTSSNAPSVSVAAQYSTSKVSAGFVCAEALSYTATTGTLRGQVAGGPPVSDTAVSVASADVASAGVTTPVTTLALAPAQTELISEATTIGGTSTQQGAISVSQTSIAIPSTFAVVAVEIN